MTPTLANFLQSKGFTNEDIRTVDNYIEEERKEDYTVGFDVLNVKELNPFYSTDEAIDLLDRLGADSWCWDNCSERLDELWKDDSAPESYLDSVKALFKLILGEELCQLYLLYHEGFFENFEDEYLHNSNFLECLYRSLSNNEIVASVETAAINYIKAQHSNTIITIDPLDVLEDILDTVLESNPNVLTPVLISQINTFYIKYFEMSSIDLLKLWGKYLFND
jgi:hypothetical protein